MEMTAVVDEDESSAESFMDFFRAGETWFKGPLATFEQPNTQRDVRNLEWRK